MHLAVLSACRREYNDLLGWLWSEIVFVNIINLNTNALLGNVILCLYKSKKNCLQYAPINYDEKLYEIHKIV